MAVGLRGALSLAGPGTGAVPLSSTGRGPFAACTEAAMTAALPMVSRKITLCKATSDMAATAWAASGPVCTSMMGLSPHAVLLQGSPQRKVDATT